MKKNLLALLLISLLVLCGCDTKDSEKNIKKANNYVENNEEVDNTQKENKVIKEEVKTEKKVISEVKEEIKKEIIPEIKEEIKSDTAITKEEVNIIIPEEVETVAEEKITYSSKDTVVINELESVKKETEVLLKSGDSVKDKAKGVFITLVDFIFYDGEIKGVKFDELTNEGKQKALEIIAKIDISIESKFPNYKDQISYKTKDALNKASDLIKKGASNINSFAKEKLGADNYNNLIEAKDDLVKYSKNAISIVGNFSSSIYNSSKEKLKNWYENLKKN